MIDIIPGILEKSFDEIKHKISLVRDYVPWVHIDVLDGTFVPNNSFIVWDSFKIFDQEIKMEAHLMVAHPELYVADLAANGFDRLIAHVEVDSIRDFLIEAKHHHVERGVALDAPSDLEAVEPYLDEVDTVLVMMYKAGASGGEFEREQLPKVRKIHEEYKELPIEVDGGIKRETAPLVVNNGATRLVSTSYLFWKNSQRIPEAIEELKAQPLLF